MHIDSYMRKNYINVQNVSCVLLVFKNTVKSVRIHTKFPEILSSTGLKILNNIGAQ